MTGSRSHVAAGHPATPGRFDVLSAAGVGFLVACGLSRLLAAVVELVVLTPLKEATDGDEALELVVVLGAGLMLVVLSFASVWIGGRVARRMTKDTALLQRVARAYAWILAVLGGLGLLLFCLSLIRLESAAETIADAKFREAMSPGALGYAGVVLIAALTIIGPFVGRAGVLREPRAGRTRRARVRRAR